MGGSGKSPHAAFFADLLKDQYRVALLSRGYKRKTSGFRMVTEKDDHTVCGDEPKMYKTRFPELPVAVSESRVQGIQKLKNTINPDVVILDDVFQHRKIKPNLNVLITSYNRPFYQDHLFPAGTLRETTSGKGRADIIIVSKCPDDLGEQEKNQISKKIAPSNDQVLLFSHYRYSDPIPAFNKAKHFTGNNVVLLTGIADPAPLETHISKKYNLLKTFEYSDHHEFTITELQQLKDYFNNIAASEKSVLTTEKDLARLQKTELKEAIADLPVFVIRVQVEFSEAEKKRISKLIEQKING